MDEERMEGMTDKEYFDAKEMLKMIVKLSKDKEDALKNIEEAEENALKKYQA